MGIANKWSIGWGIAKALSEAGANQVFTYRRDHSKRALTRLNQLLKQPGHIVGPCDVQNEAEMAQVFSEVETHFGGKLDILVHSIAHADPKDLTGNFLDTSRAGFSFANDVSVYSLIDAARRARPLMQHGGSIITISFHGGEKVVPDYKVMGIAKSALEASMRYLANELGPHAIRVNAISAGPIKTLASSGVKNLRSMLDFVEKAAPLRRNIDLAQIGNTAVFLASELSSAITGEVLHVDSGMHILGVGPGSPNP